MTAAVLDPREELGYTADPLRPWEPMIAELKKNRTPEDQKWWDAKAKEHDDRWKPVCFPGDYLWEDKDWYNGFLNIKGEPRGPGVLYKWESGDADVGYFEMREMKGAGVRFNKARDVAFKLQDGEVVGSQITLEEACSFVELENAPGDRINLASAEIDQEMDNLRMDNAWNDFRMSVGLEPLEPEEDPMELKWKDVDNQVIHFPSHAKCDKQYKISEFYDDDDEAESEPSSDEDET